MKVELLSVEQFSKQFKDTPKSKVIELLYQVCGESLQNTNEKVELQQRIDKAIGLIYDYQTNDEDNVNYKELLYVLKGEPNNE